MIANKILIRIINKSRIIIEMIQIIHVWGKNLKVFTGYNVIHIACERV